MSLITPAPSLAAETIVGAVTLTVSDLSRARAFYEQTLGLEAHERADGDLALGAPGGPPLVILHPDPAARPHDPHATGLFHLAILFPTRLDLAHALGRIAETRYPLAGASDHLISEAVYLQDPDGNGIELYRDRPRTQWPREADGALKMATLALDLRDVIGELGDSDRAQDRVPGATRMGHVHLQVADVENTEAFYSGVLGFDVTVRGYPGALFVSAGGYHHHIGLNTWNSAGASPPAPGSDGLRSYEVIVPEPTELEHVLGRVADAGIGAEAAPDAGEGAALVRDPSGNAVLLRSR